MTLSHNAAVKGVVVNYSSGNGLSHFVLTMAWWRHQMETFSTLLAICAGNSPVPGEFPAQRPVTRSFGVFCNLHPNKRLSKQWWGWWFETPSCPLWRHRNGYHWFMALVTNSAPSLYLNLRRVSRTVLAPAWTNDDNWILRNNSQRHYKLTTLRPEQNGCRFADNIFSASNEIYKFRSVFLVVQ